MTCQKHIVRADHAALRFEHGANPSGFPRRRRVKDELADRSQQEVDFGNLFGGIGAFFDSGEKCSIQ